MDQVKNPYFIQEWGYQAWNTSEDTTISLVDVRKATDTVFLRLDKSFFEYVLID